MERICASFCLLCVELGFPQELLYHLHLAGCEYAFIVFYWCPVNQIILLSYSGL